MSMKKVLIILAAASISTAALAAPEEKAATAKAPEHGIFAPSDIKWVDAPPALPAGAKAAVLEGDPGQEGLFTLRIWAPDGYKIAPHWHPAFEHVTVISGALRVGMGDKFDESKLQSLPAGGFSWMAPGMRHFAMVRGETILQVHAMGPWQLYYVNPADDPRTMKK
jgi:quercetin dioxygenase-like cupin family protein